ncbi:MAG: hypothetical protein IJ484_02315 [Oscillospiraceae bacterium]|nr:hypothetical protein [Oscillospiraceae bacterium]
MGSGTDEGPGVGPGAVVGCGITVGQGTGLAVGPAGEDEGATAEPLSAATITDAVVKDASSTTLITVSK